MTNTFRKIFTLFAKHKINYLIVGGVAVNLYGYTRFTADIDILLALDEKNLKKMEKVMHSLGYIERLPVQVKELSNTKKVKQWIRQKNMTAYTFISNRGIQLDLDVLVGHSLNFEKYFKNKKTLKMWNIPLPVVSIGDLIGMKKEAGREKDMIDLEALLKLKSL